MDFKPLRDCMAHLIELGVPGLELAVSREHEVIFHECMGYSDYDRTRATAPSDRYWLYSCSKPITATAGMQCIEQGLFSLDEPVYKYLPAYKNAYVMENGEKKALEKPVTIRNLFTMSAGF